MPPVAFYALQFSPAIRIVSATAIGLVAAFLLRDVVRRQVAIGAPLTVASYAISPLLGSITGCVYGVISWILKDGPSTRRALSVGLVGAAVGTMSGMVATLAISRPGGAGGFLSNGSILSGGVGGLPVWISDTQALLWVFVLVASVINATSEEWLFRHVVIQRLTLGGLQPWTAAAISSLSFGAAHFFLGLPGGLTGSLLAIAFGAVMSVAYLRLSDPRPFLITAHTFADIVILAHVLGS